MSALAAFRRRNPRGAIGPDEPRHVLLERVMNEHALLNVRIGDAAESALSAIIELVPEDGYLVLDAFKPDIDPAHVDKSSTVVASTRLEGVALSFATRLVARGEERGAAFYKLPYPETVDYAQRRREHRVTVPLSKGARLKASGDDNIEFTGELRDLSPSGFSASVEAQVFSRLAEHEAWRGHCTLSLPGGESVTGQMEICHLMPASNTAAPRIGVRFIDLDARTERRIEAYVAGLDREQARLR